MFFDHQNEQHFESDKYVLSFQHPNPFYQAINFFKIKFG
jgi:hypothetical protein